MRESIGLEMEGDKSRELAFKRAVVEPYQESESSMASNAVMIDVIVTEGTESLRI